MGDVLFQFQLFFVIEDQWFGLDVGREQQQVLEIIGHEDLLGQRVDAIAIDELG